MLGVQSELASKQSRMVFTGLGVGKTGLCGSQSIIQVGRVRFLRCVAWKKVGVNANMLYTSKLFKSEDKHSHCGKIRMRAMDKLLIPTYPTSIQLLHVTPRIYAIIVCQLMIEISNQLTTTCAFFTGGLSGSQ